MSNALNGENKQGFSGKSVEASLEEYRTIQSESQTYSHTYTSVTDGTPVYVLIEPEDLIKVKIGVNSDQGIDYNLYKNPDATAGTAMAGDDFNLASDKSLNLVTPTHSPTVTSTGTSVVDTQREGATGTGDSSQGATEGAVSEEHPGWIVDSSVPLLVEVTPGAANFVSVLIQVERHPYKV